MGDSSVVRNRIGDENPPRHREPTRRSGVGVGPLRRYEVGVSPVNRSLNVPQGGDIFPEEEKEGGTVGSSFRTAPHGEGNRGLSGRILGHGTCGTLRIPYLGSHEKEVLH